MTKRVSDMSTEEHRKVLQTSRRRRRKKQEALLSMFDFTCQECGLEEKTLGFFEFHHVNPATKTARIAELLGSASFENILKEVNKCIMLCPNCHKYAHLKLKQQEDL